MFGMLSVLADLQRELIVANTRDGLAAARARGRKGGRPPSSTPTRSPSRNSSTTPASAPSNRSPTSSTSPAPPSTGTSRRGNGKRPGLQRTPKSPTDTPTS